MLIFASFCLYLTKEGYEVLIAHTGIKAMELLQSLSNVVILDIMLPGTDGWQVCRAFAICRTFP